MRPGTARRRALLAIAAAAALALCGCGWTPLYADRATEPGDAELRAIQVAPIPERLGQKLEMGLRNAFNPSGASTPKRYILRTTLLVVRQDLGIQSEGLGTVGQVDVIATFALSDLKTGAALLTNTTHAAESFDILPNGYATVVAENDARARTIDDMQREIVTRLTLFMQRRAAPQPATASPGSR